MVGTAAAFAAVKQDGSVVTWLGAGRGSNSDEIRDQVTRGVRDVFRSTRAFAALKEDGSMVMWSVAGSSDNVKSELTVGVDRVGTQ